MKELAIPDCFGTYEAGNRLCDGRKGDRRHPRIQATICALRRGCVKVAAACTEHSCTPEEWLERAPKDLPSLFRRGDLLFEPIIFIPEKKFARAGKKSEVRTELQKEKTFALVDHFTLMMRDAFPRRRFVTDLDRTNKPLIFEVGTFYIENHLKYRKAESQSYLSWFCKDLGKKDYLVAQVVPHLRRSCVSVRLPYPETFLVQNVPSGDFQKLHPVAEFEGKIHSRCCDLNLEGVGLAVSLIARFNRDGSYPLPSRI